MVTSNNEKNHWLDYADDKFSEKEISDIRSALDVLYLFIPFPFFWALYDQQVNIILIIIILFIKFVKINNLIWFSN